MTQFHSYDSFLSYMDSSAQELVRAEAEGHGDDYALAGVIAADMDATRNLNPDFAQQYDTDRAVGSMAVNKMAERIEPRQFGLEVTPLKNYRDASGTQG